MRRLLVLAALASACLAGAPALSDAPPSVSRHARPGVPAAHPRAIHCSVDAHRPRRRTEHRWARSSWASPASGPLPPVYGPEPRYFSGAGDGSPNAGFGAFAPQPVAISEYREAYIGRGLFYNVPPQPVFPSRQVLSVRY